MTVKQPSRAFAPTGRKRYATNCTLASANDLDPMLDDAREISRRAFLRHVDRDNLRQLAQSLGYADHPARGLTLAGDYHVTYHKSRYRRRPCVFLCWSGIEYIFI